MNSSENLSDAGTDKLNIQKLYSKFFSVIVVVSVFKNNRKGS